MRLLTVNKKVVFRNHQFKFWCDIIPGLFDYVGCRPYSTFEFGIIVVNIWLIKLLSKMFWRYIAHVIYCQNKYFETFRNCRCMKLPILGQYNQNNIVKKLPFVPDFEYQRATMVNTSMLVACHGKPMWNLLQQYIPWITCLICFNFL